MFKLGVMTEEAGDDLQTVLGVVRKLGLEFIEISWLWNKKVSEFSDREVDAIKLGLNDNGVSVSCISPMVFFNVPLRAAADERSYWGSYTRHMEDLRRSIEIAHRFGTRIIRIFGFKTASVRRSLAAPVGQVSRTHRIGGERGCDPGGRDLFFQQYQHLLIGAAVVG